jgi:PPM family protein phosphatase
MPDSTPVSDRARRPTRGDAANNPIPLCAGACTDTGRARELNEDYLAYLVPGASSREAAYGALFLVCDGVGGGVSGEVASNMAGGRIMREYYDAPQELSPSVRLAQAIERANTQVYTENREQPEGRRMTTTVVAALIMGAKLHLAHTGDSRAYVITRGQIVLVTRDHSWVAELVRSGDLTEAEAEAHPWRNRITRALGMHESIDIEQRVLDLLEGDRLLLCSDGLTRHVAEEEILEVVANCEPGEASRRLIDLANERGGQDNISVVIARLNGPETRCEEGDLG